MGLFMSFPAYYEWKISFRYMVPSKKQAFTSVISVLSLVGIIVGVWALIVVTSVMNGFRSELLDRILGVNGHIIIKDLYGLPIKNYQKEIDYLNNITGVITAMPVIESTAMVQVESATSTGSMIRGMTKKDLFAMKSVSSHIKQGSLNDFNGDKIAIGIGMARKFGVSVGDRIDILSPDGDVTPFGVSPRVKSYEICAIYEVGMYEYDSAIIFMPLTEAQSFFNLNSEINSIELFLKNPDKFTNIENIINNHYQDRYNVVSWNERNKAFFSALNVERNTMFMILSLIVIVAALNIVSGLVMLVKDKSSDIAILRTMGAPNIAILRIFIIAGMIIGVLGTFVGFVLGVVTCWNLSNIQKFISKLTGVDVFNPKLYFLSNLPYKLDYSEIAFVLFLSLFLSFMATLIPALQASKVDPISALRYE